MAEETSMVPIKKGLHPAKNEERQEIIKWLALPPRSRVPRLQKDLAIKLKVSDTFIRNVSREPGVVNAIKKVYHEKLGEHIHDVLEALVATAKTEGKDGSADRKLYFVMLGLDNLARDLGLAEKDSGPTHLHIHNMGDPELIRSAMGEILEDVAEELGVSKDRMRKTLQSKFERELKFPDDPDVSGLKDIIDVDFEEIDDRKPRKSQGRTSSIKGVPKEPTQMDGGQAWHEAGNDQVEPEPWL